MEKNASRIRHLHILGELPQSHGPYFGGPTAADFVHTLSRLIDQDCWFDVLTLVLTPYTIFESRHADFVGLILSRLDVTKGIVIVVDGLPGDSACFHTRLAIETAVSRGWGMVQVPGHEIVLQGKEGALYFSKKSVKFRSNVHHSVAYSYLGQDSRTFSLSITIPSSHEVEYAGP